MSLDLAGPISKRCDRNPSYDVQGMAKTLGCGTSFGSCLCEARAGAEHISKRHERKPYLDNHGLLSACYGRLHFLIRKHQFNLPISHAYVVASEQRIAQTHHASIRTCSGPRKHNLK